MRASPVPLEKKTPSVRPLSGGGIHEKIPDAGKHAAILPAHFASPHLR